MKKLGSSDSCWWHLKESSPPEWKQPNNQSEPECSMQAQYLQSAASRGALQTMAKKQLPAMIKETAHPSFSVPAPHTPLSTSGKETWRQTIGNTFEGGHCVLVWYTSHGTKLTVSYYLFCVIRGQCDNPIIKHPNTPLPAEVHCFLPLTAEAECFETVKMDLIQ